MKRKYKLVLVITGVIVLTVVAIPMVFVGALVYRGNSQMNAGINYMNSLKDKDIQPWIERTKKYLSEYDPSVYEIGVYGGSTGKPIPSDLKKLKVIRIDIFKDKVIYLWMGGMDHTCLIVKKTENGSFKLIACFNDEQKEKIIWPKDDNMDYSKRNKPSINLNKAVTNEGLKKLIQNNHADKITPEIIEEFKRTNFLVPIITDELYTEPTDQNGKTIVKKDSKIKILLASTTNNKPVLPIFTDWDEIRAWTDKPVSTLVVPISDVIYMGLKQNYEGIIINPAGKSWHLDRATLNKIKIEIEKP